MVGSPGCGQGIHADGGARDQTLTTGGTSGSPGVATSTSGAESVSSSGAAGCGIVTLRADADGDGFTTELGKDICQGDAILPGFALPVEGRHPDCDDTNPNLTASDAYCPDRDGDGLGDSRASPVRTCVETPPPGMVTDGRDCDDTDPQVPDADADQDGDGYSPLCNAGIQRRLALLHANCDDHDATRHSNAEERPLDNVPAIC